MSRQNLTRHRDSNYAGHIWGYIARYMDLMRSLALLRLRLCAALRLIVRINSLSNAASRHTAVRAPIVSFATFVGSWTLHVQCLGEPDNAGWTLSSRRYHGHPGD
jgi:hypothetical protein